jgi:hypothetical protein
MSGAKLVKIFPVQYDPSSVYPRILWYRGLSINKDLTLKRLNEIKELLTHDKPVTTSSNSNNLLLWQYEGEPLMILNLANGSINTTQNNLEKFGVGEENVSNKHLFC